VITIVKWEFVVVEAVGKWESRSDFQGGFGPAFPQLLARRAVFIFRLSRPLFAHRFAAHLDAVRVVHQAVEDAVGQRGSPICSCQRDTGSCEVRIIERV